MLIDIREHNVVQNTGKYKNIQTVNFLESKSELD